MSGEGTTVILVDVIEHAYDIALLAQVVELLSDCNWTTRGAWATRLRISR